MLALGALLAFILYFFSTKISRKRSGGACHWSTWGISHMCWARTPHLRNPHTSLEVGMGPSVSQDA